MRSGELKRKTPLKSKTPLKRGGRLKPVGRRGKRRAPALRKAYAEVAARHEGRCEAQVDGVCRGVVSDPHHLYTRLTRPDQVTEADSIIGVCRPCHDWIGDNPKKACDLGVARKSWQ